MENSIRNQTYVVWGLAVVIILGTFLGWFFVIRRPQGEAIDKLQKQYDARALVAQDLGRNLKAQKLAEDKLRYYSNQLAFYQNRYRSFQVDDIGTAGSTTPLQQATRENTWQRLVQEYFYDYGNAIRSVLRRAADEANIPADRDGHTFVLVSSVKVDTPPQAPEDIDSFIPSNGLMRPTSATNNGDLDVSVTGTFQEIKTFLNNITRQEFPGLGQKPILFVVGNIKLSGISPRITAAFKLTPFLLVRGKGLHLQATAAGGAAAAGGAGGAGGGLPGAGPLGPGGPPGPPGAGAPAGGPPLPPGGPPAGPRPAGAT